MELDFSKLTKAQQAKIKWLHENVPEPLFKYTQDLPSHMATILTRAGWIEPIEFKRTLSRFPYGLTPAGRAAYEAWLVGQQPITTLYEGEAWPGGYDLSYIRLMQGNPVAAQVDPLKDELAAAQREIEALRIALEPFAKQAERLIGSGWEDGAQIPPFVAYYLTNGDIRCAAEVLGKDR